MTPALTQDALRQLLASVTEPLLALHHSGRIHGALSDAVLRTRPDGGWDIGRVKLMALREVPDMQGHYPSPDAARAGFAPFECYAADPAWPRGPWTDIYGLSALAYRLITDQPPPHALQRAVQPQLAPLAAQPWEGYDPNFLAVIDRGLAFAPMDRPDDLAAFAQALALPEAGADAGVPAAAVPIVAADIAPLPEPEPTRVSLPTEPHPSAAAAPSPPPVTEDRLTAAPVLQAAPPAAAASSRRALVSGILVGIALTLTVVSLYHGLTGPSDAPTVQAALPAGEDRQPAKAAGSSISPASTPEPAPRQDPVPSPEPTAADQITPTPTAPPPVLEVPEPPASASASDPAASPLAALIASDPSAPAQGMVTTEPSPEPASPPEPSALPTAAAATAAATEPEALPGLSPQAVQQATELAQSVEPEPAAPPSSVTFDIQPWGEIIVDGRSRGVSPPLRTLTLPAGTHTIVVRNPNGSPHQRRIVLDGGKPARIAHTFQ